MFSSKSEAYATRRAAPPSLGGAERCKKATKAGGGGGEARSRFRPQFCTNYIKLTLLLRDDCQLHVCHWIFINRNCASKEESGGERRSRRDGESAGEGEGQEKKEKEKNSLRVYSSELEYLTGWEWFLAIRQ